jgi:hypothetical protein
MLKPGEKKLTGKQKAAIVLVALGTEVAAKVLPHLSDAEVEELSLEIARLGSVPAEVRQQVITEFYEVCLAQNLALEGGLDHAREMLERAYGPERAQMILEKLIRAMQMLPFDSIKRVHPAQLSTFLQDEHPQTIALVIAYLDPQVRRCGAGRACRLNCAPKSPNGSPRWAARPLKSSAVWRMCCSANSPASPAKSSPPQAASSRWSKSSSGWTATPSA